MQRPHSAIPAAFAASAAAGPIFLAALGLATLYSRVPQPVPLSGQAVLELLEWLPMLLPSVVIGFVIAVAPNIIGASIMAGLAESNSIARAPEAWLAAGGAAGLAMTQIVSPGALSTFGFALCATSVACAGICHRLVVLD